MNLSRSRLAFSLSFLALAAFAQISVRQTDCLQVSANSKRDARIADKATINATSIFQSLFKKKPFSKLWSVEQKWDDIFKRFMSIQDSVRQLMLKNMMRDLEYYADVSISHQCAEDMRYVHDYAKQSTNFRWLMHMFDSMGKSEPGTLTGNLAHLGHVIQCIKVRAPAGPSNHSFQERFFEQQTELLGERFRGKYCLASVRPILPRRPPLVSRFESIFNESLLSNISYMGEPLETLKQRANEVSIGVHAIHQRFDREHNRLDQVPFESELYAYLIAQRNFMYTLPRFIGVCYPDSCTKEDIRFSLQKTLDDEHQVVDIEFECEVEERSTWNWFNTPRLIVYVFLFLVVFMSLVASLIRHVLVDRLALKHNLDKNSGLANLIATLDIMSMDKCAGILFVKTKRASPIVDRSRLENNRSTSIDALKGFLILMLVYSELVHLGCLPVPFMWAKWADAMFPFYRSLMTQTPLNTSVWTEAFYIISAYLISLKLLENSRPSRQGRKRTTNLASFVLKRYIRLLLPMVAFILMSYIWPRLSNGFVMQDQADKLLKPCDNYGWTNVLMFHNHNHMNETCLWPSHVSASFFQLHLLSYPILLLLVYSLRTQLEAIGTRGLIHKLLTYSGLGLIILLGLFGLVYPALLASKQNIIVPFLIDYLDYDNYRRVIEWTVMPTYNHLTSYMVGIWLAYLVVRQRMRRDHEMNDWRGSHNYMRRDGSLESVTSSSTQELNYKPSYTLTSGKINLKSAAESTSSQQTTNYDEDRGGVVSQVAKVALSALMFLLVWLSTTASWYWNGLGQPMSAQQTFWYMMGTKLLFNMAFAYLFYQHFARRRNSMNPWMLVRFLVPIGRMSLMVFYVSWLVIWFDLLTSLYQWHPSHYFVFEKYNEIIFMTLILAMLAYGAFEGTVKITQYARRKAKLSRMSDGAVLNNKWPSNNLETAHGFELLFVPLDADQYDDDDGTHANAPGLSAKAEQVSPNKSMPANKLMMANSQGREPSVTDGDANKSDADNDLGAKSSSAGRRYQCRQVSGKPHVSSSGQTKAKGHQGGHHLSISDQYKLNAELRANYSFASIGLYESAGAIGDLAHGSTSDPPRDSPDVQSSRKR